MEQSVVGTNLDRQGHNVESLHRDTICWQSCLINSLSLFPPVPVKAWLSALPHYYQITLALAFRATHRSIAGQYCYYVCTIIQSHSSAASLVDIDSDGAGILYLSGLWQ